MRYIARKAAKLKMVKKDALGSVLSGLMLSHWGLWFWTGMERTQSCAGVQFSIPVSLEFHASLVAERRATARAAAVAALRRYESLYFLQLCLFFRFNFLPCPFTMCSPVPTVCFSIPVHPNLLPASSYLLFFCFPYFVLERAPKKLSRTAQRRESGDRGGDQLSRHGGHAFASMQTLQEC